MSRRAEEHAALQAAKRGKEMVRSEHMTCPFLYFRLNTCIVYFPFFRLLLGFNFHVLPRRALYIFHFLFFIYTLYILLLLYI